MQLSNLLYMVWDVAGECSYLINFYLLQKNPGVCSGQVKSLKHEVSSGYSTQTQFVLSRLA